MGNRTVNRMGYGAMQLAGPGVFRPSEDRSGRRCASRGDRGVNHIDASDYYGPHVANQLLRERFVPIPMTS